MSLQRQINDRGRIKIHERDVRGKTNTGWLDSRHTFSFGHFQDPTRMGFRTLRVINDDRVAPGAGFGEHPHANMEIISYVLDGALEHKDSMGTGSIIRSGELQYMSAGSGVTHSEYNHSNDQPVHFYQIWILPEAKGAQPKYEQIEINREKTAGQFHLVGDHKGGKGKLQIRQNVRMLVANLSEGQQTSYEFAPEHAGFLQILRGQIMLNGEILKEGDGAEIENVASIAVRAEADSELILFDLA